jgi:hypothetical protein
MKTIVKTIICALLVSVVLVSVGAASVSSDLKKYDSANEKQFKQLEKSFKCQYSHFAGHKNVIVISSSANFETCNIVRAFMVLPDGKLRLTDYKGKVETIAIKTLQSKYESHFFTKAPKTFDTSGRLSDNLSQLKVKKTIPPKHKNPITAPRQKINIVGTSDRI